ncbi:MAG: M20/M25/M40 family metallo-hydrolase [Kiritimatiellae bacterium]|nr:M20/M25/M40 family metallo-hydrolase [Kiritimatiellia bacterium]
MSKSDMDENTQKEYFELLKFESVGADPAKLKDCTACAMWLKDWLKKLDFAGELILAKGSFAPPVLFAQRPGDEGASTILFYGHYDVQPADPIESWKTPPFEPTIIGDRIYCRGSQDDKGQFFAFLQGLADYLETAPEGKRPTIKIVLEGQEESGSEALMKLAQTDLRKSLAADVLLVCDTSAAAGLRPAIVAGLRGVSHFTVKLFGANRDLHSGEYGAIAPNAAQAIAELVASLHTPSGAIAVAGFMDGVEMPSEEEKAEAEKNAPSAEDYEKDIGCAPVGGEEGKSIVERNSFLPTIEVNGIHSGYGGPGAKTVIAPEAFAKISMRLVPGQNPRRVFEAVKAHLEANTPRGMRLEIEDWNPGAGGFRLPLASPLFRLASEVLKEMDPRGPVFHWDGASIPVVSILKEASGAAPLIVGWGQPEDRIHSPNESYSFAQFALARDWARRILEAL